MPPAPPDRLPGLMLALLGVAGFFYMVMMSNIIPEPGVDAAGRGLAQGFATIAGVGLWMALGFLLLVGAVQGRMPVWSLIFVILLPLSGFASVVAVGLSPKEADWPLLVPGFVPILIALYALWARLPHYHLALPPWKMTLGTVLAVLVLSAAPFVAQITAPSAAQIARATAEQQVIAKKQAELDAAAAKSGALPKGPSPTGFERLGPTSSLADYLPYLNGPFATAARKDIRLVKSRQADVVTLLNHGQILALPRLLEFDVAATPELCQAYGDALTKVTQNLDPKINPDNAIADAMALQEQVPNIQWLQAEHCNLDQPLSLLELNVRLLAEPKLARFSELLGKLRKVK